MPTRTHTYALLEVPPVVYAAMKALLQRAEGDAWRQRANDQDSALDMHGLAVVPRAAARTDGLLEIGTIISSTHGRARVEVQIGTEVAQWDIGDAKKINAMLTEAIEAAISDELIMKFLTEKVGLPADKCARLLIEFRELRQGSKGTVNPS